MSASVTPLRTYYIVFAALIALTVLTVVVSFLPLAGIWHLVVGLSIAMCKALLVLLFFMHLLHANRMLWVVAAGSLLWLAIMMFYTLNDYMTRVSLPGSGS
jgi:cytochrome c oxidase subunit 4